MLSFQDYLYALKEDKVLEFIKDAVSKFKGSTYYKQLVTAYKYYDGDNDILDRLQWFYNSGGAKENDRFKANNQTPSNFFRKIVLQENSYLLNNGVGIDDNIKKLLGRKFDIRINELGLNALITGRSFLYCFINDLGNFDCKVFTSTEFIPLFDEKTSELKAGIRFWQTDENKPVYIEFYSDTGITSYTMKKSLIEVDGDEKPYIKKIVGDTTKKEVIAESWGVVPVLVLNAEKGGKSRLSNALKNKIDLYDIILSDFGNNLEDSKDVYWILKNYQGQDMGEFLADYKYYKTIKVDEDGEANAQTIEVPYQAREKALEILRKDIYESSMALDTSTLSGGSLTNVAIKSLMEDLNLKVDNYEFQVLDLLESVIALLDKYKPITNKDFEIHLTRRTLINDTEIIANLMAMRSEISDETFYKLNPYIEDADQEMELMKGQDNNNLYEGKPVK